MRASFAASCLLCLSIAGAAELDLSPPRKEANPADACSSVVVRRCTHEPGPGGKTLGPPVAAKRPGAGADPNQVLEAIVIEGERLRRPTPPVRSAIEAATARPTVRSFESGEGGVCTCVTPCPPWPSPCCSCTKGGRDAMIDNVIRH